MATRRGADLQWVSQDHLTGTALVTDGAGAKIGEMRFYPFGAARSGSVPTDRRFTGQRLDGTGLYYYGARYYDAELARFISADTLVPQPANPQPSTEELSPQLEQSARLCSRSWQRQARHP